MRSGWQGHDAQQLTVEGAARHVKHFSILGVACLVRASMSTVESQLSNHPPSVLHRTVTSLPTVTSMTRLEALANDHEKGLPVSLEARSGRTLEDMLRTP